MPDLVISALISSFTFVRLLKGPWLRYPQFLAAAMIGSVVLSLVAEKIDPGSSDSMINATVYAFAGSAAGIFLLGQMLG